VLKSILAANRECREADMLLRMKKKTTGVLLFLFAVVVSLPSPAEINGELPAIAEMLESYEQSVAKVCAEGSLRERSSALLMLAAVASPYYRSCLAGIEEDRFDDTYCRIDVCRAIGMMRDDSKEAHRMLLESLWSLDPRLIEDAVDVIIKLPFSEIWDRKSPPAILTGVMGIKSAEKIVAKTTGVARCAPWKDPAWRFLPPVVRIGILSRAGSRDAGRLLGKELGELPESRIIFTWKPNPVEPSDLVDRDTLRKALHSGEDQMRFWGAISLARLGEVVSPGDEGYDPVIEKEQCWRLGFLIRESHSRDALWKFINTVKRSSLCSVSDLSSLNEDDLYDLLNRDGLRWLRLVQEELVKRGRSLSADQLMGRAALPGGGMLHPPEKIPEFWRVAYINAVTREENIPKLCDLIEESTMYPKDRDNLAWFVLSNLYRHPVLVQRMSEEQFERVREVVWTLYRSTGLDDSDRSLSFVGWWAPRLAALALFQTPEERDALFNEWIGRPEALRDWKSLGILMGGRDEYAGSLRRVLPGAYGSRVLSAKTGDVLGALVFPRVGGSRICIRRLPFEAPSGAVMSPRLRRIHREFADRVAEMYPDESPAVMAAAFLGVRLGRDALRRSRLIERDVPYAVSFQAGILLRSMCDGCEFPNLLPPPPVSPTAVERIEGLLEAARESHVRLVVTAFLKPKTEEQGGVSCSEPPDPIKGDYVRFQRSIGGLVRKISPDELHLLRRFLDSENPVLRREVEWTIWKKTRDGEIPERWAREYDQTDDTGVKAELLDLLIGAARPEDSFRILQALDSDSARLRLVGLVGVRARADKNRLEKVIGMFTDPEPDVASSAIGILGRWLPPEAVPMLIDLATMNEPSLAYPASRVLQKYHTSSAINLLMDRLTVSIDDEQKMRNILRILDMEVFAMEQDVLEHSIERADAADARAVLSWWKEIGNSTGERSWIRPAFERMIRVRTTGSGNTIASTKTPVFFQSSEFPYYYSSPAEISVFIGAWLNRVPEDDIVSLFNNALVGPWRHMEGVGQARWARASLEALLDGKKDSSWPGLAPREVVSRITGRDCGEPEEVVCSVRERVEDCWYEAGIAEGLWP